MSFESKQIDRYAIVRLLGSGGMGDVYLAEDPRIGQQVAIKVIRTDLTPYPDEQAVHDAARLFQREAKAIVRLDHPHILPLYDYGEEHIGNAPVIYLVMPYRPEGSLTDWLRQRANKSLLDPQDVAQLLNQAADALQHAHEHDVIHQDVKPSNFLVRSRPDTPARPDLLLSDFGIARLMTATSSVSQSVRGTPAYMAPEQWEGEPVPATDQYALAVMAYELLTGKLPFQGGPGKMMYHHINTQPQPPGSLNPELSSDIDIVLLQALAKQPDQRFASMTAFANAFRQAAQSRTVPEVQSILSSALEEVAAETFSPSMVSDGKEIMIPTLVNTDRQLAGSDSETYVKPGGTPSMPDEKVAVGGAIDNVQQDWQWEKTQLPVGVDPITPIPLTAPVVRQRKSRSRVLPISALVVITLVLIAGGIVYALPALTGRGAGGQTGSTGSSTPTISSSQRSNEAISANIAIVPDSKTIRNAFSIEAVTGTPDASQQQYQGARFLSTTTSAYAQTAQATGQGTIPGTQASGTVCIDNFDTTAPLKLVAGSTYSNTYPSSPSFHMVLDATENLPPAPSSSTWSQVCGPAHVLEVGAIGNNIFNNNQFGTLTYSVFTNSALRFTNGKDPQNYVAVQQSDIDNAAHSLEQTNAPDAQQLVQPLVHANERLVGSPACNPKVTSDHKAGDKATSVTVSVSYTCTGEAYDYNGALAMAARLLTGQANTHLGNGYAPVANIQATLTSATITDTQNGTVTLIVDAGGTWAYHFTDAQKQALAELIAGKTKSEAQTLLVSQTGIGQVVITLSSSSANTLPADAGKITIEIQSA